MDTVAREKPKADGTRGKVDIREDEDEGEEDDQQDVRWHTPTPHSSEQERRRTRQEMAERSALQMLKLSGMDEHGSAITMNLLSKSGLTDNRVVRDLNILKTALTEAARHLRADELQPELDRHFGLDNLKHDKRTQGAGRRLHGCGIG